MEVAKVMRKIAKAKTEEEKLKILKAFEAFCKKQGAVEGIKQVSLLLENGK